MCGVTPTNDKQDKADGENSANAEGTASGTVGKLFSTMTLYIFLSAYITYKTSASLWIITSAPPIFSDNTNALLMDQHKFCGHWGISIWHSLRYAFQLTRAPNRMVGLHWSVLLFVHVLSLVELRLFPPSLRRQTADITGTCTFKDYAEARADCESVKLF